MSRSYEFPIAPMEAELVGKLPQGLEWQYEPKWDGFRCIGFRDGKKVTLQSKSGRPLIASSRANQAAVQKRLPQGKSCGAPLERGS